MGGGYKFMDQYDMNHIHELLRGEGKYEWKDRLSVKPLEEKSAIKPELGELIINNVTGHISIMTNEENKRVSATKNIETELDLQKYWLSTLSDMLDVTINNLRPLMDNYNEEENKIKGYYDILHHLEDLMSQVTKLRNIVDKRTATNSWLLFTYYDTILDYLPVFLADYLQVLDVLRRIDELAYIYNDLLTPIMSRILTHTDTVVGYVDSSTKNVNSRVFKRTYLNWAKGMISFWNKTWPHTSYKNHPMYHWMKQGTISITGLDTEADNKDHPEKASISNPIDISGISTTESIRNPADDYQEKMNF